MDRGTTEKFRPAGVAALLVVASVAVRCIRRLPWHILFPVVVFLVSLSIFFPARSFGASGDDATGYLLIGRTLADGKFLLSDPVVQTMAAVVDRTELGAFGPSHYIQVGDEPWQVGPRYLLGLPMLLAIGMKLFGPSGFSVVMPVAGAGVLLGTYLAGVTIFFRHLRFRYTVGLLGALLLAVNPLFFITVVAQPMTELPGTAAILMALVALAVGLRKRQVLTVGLAGALFGFAMNIREHNILFAVPVLFMFLDWSVEQRAQDQGHRYVLDILRFGGVAFVGFLLTISIALATNAVSTGNPFDSPRSSDVGGLSLGNLFDNQGGYRVGQGSLKVYLDLLLRRLVPVPYFWIFGLMALAILARRKPLLAASAGSWVAAQLLFFSLWVNPYDRYLIPAFPVVTLLIAAGVVQVITGLVQVISWAVRALSPNRQILLCGLIALLAVPYFIPNIERIGTVLQGETRAQRAITAGDFASFEQLGRLDEDGSAVVVYTGGTPGSRGAIEAIAGVRVASNRRIDITTGFSPGFPRLFEPYRFAEYLDHLLDNGYQVFYWEDQRSDPVHLAAVAAEFELDKVATLDFSYDPPADIFKLTPGGVAASSVLANGSLESWWNEGAPDSWAVAGAAVEVSKVQDSHDGQYAVEVTTSGQKFGEVRQELPLDVGALKGSTLLLSGWVKTSVPERVSILFWDGIGATQSRFASGTGNYEFLATTLEVPQEATMLRVHLKIGGGGPAQAVFDHLRVVVLGDK